MKLTPHLMTVATITTYLALISLTLMHVEILYYAWPYPLLLSLQKWVNPGSLGTSIAGWLGGFVLVVVWADLMRRVLDRAGRGRKVVLFGTLAFSLAAWLVPLLLEF